MWRRYVYAQFSYVLVHVHHNNNPFIRMGQFPKKIDLHIPIISIKRYKMPLHL